MTPGERDIVPGVFLFGPTDESSLVRRVLAGAPDGTTRSVYDLVQNSFVGVVNPPVMLMTPSGSHVRFESDELLRMIEAESLPIRVYALRRMGATKTDDPFVYRLRVRVPEVGVVEVHVVSRPLLRQSQGNVRLTVSEVTWEVVDGR